MRSMRKLLKINLPITIGLITALVVIYKGDNNSTANYIGLIVALITVAGSIPANFFQYQKDSSTIGTVKSDTSNMVPKVDIINENTKNINKYVAEDIKANLKDITNITEKIFSDREDIRLIAKDVKYRQRLSREYKGMTTRDGLINGIDELYERNAALSIRLEEKEREIVSLSREIAQGKAMTADLKAENASLKKDNAELKSRITEMGYTDRDNAYEEEL